jgi:SAM-dependent methyltransferase
MINSIHKLISKTYSHKEGLKFLKKQKKQVMIDLGCGKYKFNNKAVGVDIVKLPGVNKVFDLTKNPYPFKAASVDLIHCAQLLEHFDFKQQLNLLLECSRILKQGGILDLRVPHAFSIGALQDPTHKSFFTYHSIEYFLKKNAKYNWYINNKISFQLIYKNTNVFLTYQNNLFRAWRIFDVLVTFFLRSVLNVSPALADLLVKILPLYYVDIIWILQKTDKKTF